MKIVFLDVDGVLNAGRRVNRGMIGFELIDWSLPGPIAHVNRITRETGAKLVISSTWRLGKTIKELRQMFAEVGIEGDIVGKTENGPCNWHIDRGYPECSTGHRGAEIADWIRNHDAINLDDKVEEFVILDDSSDMADLIDHHIHTAYDRGMVRRDCDRAIQMLGKLK